MPPLLNIYKCPLGRHGKRHLHKKNLRLKPECDGVVVGIPTE